MAKSNKTIFVCNECGYESSKWLGKCPACNNWNTFFEQKIEKYTENGVKKIKEKTEAKALNSYEGKEVNRTSTGFDELDRVLRRRISKRFANTTRRRASNRKIYINITIM